MNMVNATEVRKNWSATIDSVVREKPVFVNRTHDHLAILTLSTMNDILENYHYEAKQFQEKDGSVTLSLCGADLVANGEDLEAAKRRLASEIKDYAEDFYTEFTYWSADKQRRKHIPYVLKALLMDEKAIEGELICQNGEN